MKNALEIYQNLTPAATIHNLPANKLDSVAAQTRIAAEAPTTTMGRLSKAARQGAADGWHKGLHLTDTVKAGATAKNVALSPALSVLPYAASGLVLPFVGNVASAGVSPMLQLAFGNGIPESYAANSGIKNVASNAFKLVKEYGVAGIPEAAANWSTGYASANWAKQGAAVGAMAFGFVPGVARSANAIGSLVLFNVAPAAVLSLLGAVYYAAFRRDSAPAPLAPASTGENEINRLAEDVKATI